MPHYGIFVIIGVGGIKLSDRLYSAPSQKYAPLCYFCQGGDGGKGYLTTSYLPLCEIMLRYGIFVMIGVGELSYLTTSILPFRKIKPHYGIFVMTEGRAYK